MIINSGWQLLSFSSFHLSTRLIAKLLFKIFAFPPISPTFHFVSQTINRPNSTSITIWCLKQYPFYVTFLSIYGYYKWKGRTKRWLSHTRLFTVASDVIPLFEYEKNECVVVGLVANRKKRNEIIISSGVRGWVGGFVWLCWVSVWGCAFVIHEKKWNPTNTFVHIKWSRALRKMVKRFIEEHNSKW